MMKHFRLILLLYMFIAFGCNSIKFNSDSLVIKPYDWTMPSGNNQRQNISMSQDEINPPFALLWKYHTEAGFPEYSMTASDNILFVSNLNGDLNALNIENGKKAGDFSRKDISLTSAPVILGDNIIYICNSLKKSSLIYYSIKSGDIVWEKSIEPVSSPMIYDNDEIIIATNRGSVQKYSLNGGKLLWSKKFSESGFFHTIARLDTFIYAGDEAGNLYKINSYDGKLNQALKLTSPISSDISLYQDRLFFTIKENKLLCLEIDFQTFFETSLNSFNSSGFSYYKSNIIFGCINGDIYSIDVVSGDILWKKSLDETIAAPPLVHKDLIFIGGFNQKFHCLYASDGKTLWEFETEGRIRTSALIWNNFIIIGSDDKNIYCFK